MSSPKKNKFNETNKTGFGSIVEVDEDSEEE